MVQKVENTFNNKNCYHQVINMDLLRTISEYVLNVFVSLKSE